MGWSWANKIIKVDCDNMAIVKVLHNGRAKDATLAILARNGQLICAILIHK